MIENQVVLDLLNKKFTDEIKNVTEPYGLLTFETTKDSIIPMLNDLYTSEYKFQYLTDICGIHYPENELQLGVIYHVHSLQFNKRIRIKVFLDEKSPEIPTATTLFKAANWMERETYDFFGINFTGHPNLSRILNVDDMVAFPMRKEHPLEDPNRIDKKDEFFGR